MQRSTIMKKSLICILLAVCMILCGCEKQDTSNPNTPTETTAAEIDYTDIVCQDVNKFYQTTYAFKDSEHFINLYFSYQWVLKIDVSGSFYSIMRSKKPIGHIYTGEYTPEPGSNWKILEEKDTEYNGLTIAEYVEQDLNASNSFRCRYRYSYVEGNETKAINITVDYAEAGEGIRYELYEHVDFEAFRDHTNFDTLPQLRGGSILILGNSFIASSDVGTILQSMVDANNKSLSVTAVSRGYANVSTYTGDPDMMCEIKNGFYDAVFICGLYNTDQIAELGILKSACDQSDTELIIFPAHNENRSVISNAASTYRSLMLMDWKNEIDLLIEQGGVSQSDMCVNDSHKHSTNLAGYVGAHMIYRAIFGAVPSSSITYPSGLQTTANNKLGKYVQNGTVFDVDFTLK